MPFLLLLCFVSFAFVLVCVFLTNLIDQSFIICYWVGVHVQSHDEARIRPQRLSEDLLVTSYSLAMDLYLYLT